MSRAVIRLTIGLPHVSRIRNAPSRPSYFARSSRHSDGAAISLVANDKTLFAALLKELDIELE
jgi:hypothetical protein